MQQSHRLKIKYMKDVLQLIKTTSNVSPVSVSNYIEHHKSLSVQELKSIPIYHVILFLLYK